MPHQCVQMSTTEHLRWKGIRGHRQVTGWARLSLLAVLGVIGWGEGGISALPIDYFALGDSIASGHGLADDETACRQSVLAYPWGVVAQLQESFLVEQFALLACSGATTGALDSQVAEALSRLADRQTLITLTVGANDFGWSDLFPFAQNLCTPDDDAFDAWVASTAHTVEENLVVQLGRLLAHPQVEIILTDYHNPTNTSGAFWERVHPRCLFVNVYDRSEGVAHALNAAIMQAWQRLGSLPYVRVATVHDAFHGHEAPRPWCGTAPPEVDETWIQYPTDPDSNSTPIGGDCFHVNRAGAAQFAEAVTGLVPPDMALPLRLLVNDASLAPGETLTLTVTTTPEFTPMAVDLYVALHLPDQSLWFLHGDGSLTPEIQPYLSQWPVVPARAELFRYAFTGPESPGTYRWLAAFTEPGTGMIVGTVAQAAFTFNP
jgi:lysophospholipase L1-like esterase